MIPKGGSTNHRRSRSELLKAQLFRRTQMTQRMLETLWTSPLVSESSLSSSCVLCYCLSTSFTSTLVSYHHVSYVVVALLLQVPL